MTIAELTLRELSSKRSVWKKADYTIIKNKKNKKNEGLFIPENLAAEVQSFIQERLEQKQQERIDKIMKFSGMATGLFTDETIQSLKATQPC